ncbi:MFS transporter [Pseudomonas sp. KFB-139]|uniref:MFS transporter n=1 Tax=Pseudomonas serbiensis TaxID=3064350 RepID=A0ABT9CW06_9PSED|nr:MFS transporter [Pseudomonas sp. KFB-138]MDO7929683.1 MFS transporter [Pseudomonas sp. KFB-138]
MSAHSGRLPMIWLLALSTTAFLTILTETMPAAVLPAMSESLEQPPAGIGLLVSIYALASAAAAIPIVALTRSLPRKSLYIMLVLSFAVANGITAISTSYALTVASRVVAGLAAGVVWPVICGYAIRLVDRKDMGRAVAITLAGSTVAMVAGLPLGSMLGSLLGWRFSYGLLSLLALLVIVWVLLVVPPMPGEERKDGTSIHDVIRTPGLRVILLSAFCAILAHYTLYTYMAPLAEKTRLSGGTAQGLFLFGTGAILGVLIAGRFVDTRLRLIATTALTCTAVTMVVLIAAPYQMIASAAIFVWGASFGGMPTVFQSATGRVAEDNAELATAILTTIYNLGIFGGGAVGGLLLSYFGIVSLSGFALLIVSASLVVVMGGRCHAFPRQ